ncbi:hypothetical protein [Dyella acidisoli]|uniref:hypothetical protein n=1 Tax=Dyella acidisoli TaxID=1867834 RepID=UPI0024E103BA|nr:hypothetical protein [Dyella acidisoli]
MSPLRQLFYSRILKRAYRGCDIRDDGWAQYFPLRPFQPLLEHLHLLTRLINLLAGTILHRAHVSLRGGVLRAQDVPFGLLPLHLRLRAITLLQQVDPLGF